MICDGGYLCRVARDPHATAKVVTRWGRWCREYGREDDEDDETSSRQPRSAFRRPSSALSWPRRFSISTK